MTILIADDDRKIRFYLKSMLAKIRPQDCRILEAKNGNEMIEKCSLYRPDIAFVDVDMPCLDGLSAIDVCRSSSSLTQYVVITGYPSFSYAQKCVSLPVCDYILKPIEFAKMKEIIETLNERLSDVLNSDNSRFQLKLYDSFSLWDAIGSDEPEEPEEFPCYGFVFFMDCSNRSDLYPRLYKNLFTGIKLIGDERIKKRQVYGMLNSEDGLLRCVFQCGDPEAGRLTRRIGEVCRSLTGERQIVSCLYAKAKNLADLYKQCEAITAGQFMRFYFPTGEIHSFPRKVPSAAAACLKEIFNVLTAYQDADAVRYKNGVNRVSQLYSQPAAGISPKNAAAFLSAVMGKRISGSDAKSFCSSLLGMADHMYQGIAPQGQDWIEQIKQYIAQNYMNEISINDLSEQFHLSPNYLSKIFHDRAGIRFIDYLTEVRMENAKRLLRKNLHATVQDVSLMVGYYSVRHFSRIFQKYVGKSPSDFRKTTA